MIMLHPARDGQAARLVINGELTVVQAAEAQAELRGLCPSLAQQSLDIDLAGLAPADTATVQLLLALARSLRQQGTAARLVACDSALQSLAAVLGTNGGGRCCGLPFGATSGAAA